MEGDDKASLKVLSACEREFNLERGTLLQYLLYQKAIHLCQCIEIPVRKYAKMILNVEGEVRAAKQSRRRGRPRRDPEFSLAVAPSSSSAALVPGKAREEIKKISSSMITRSEVRRGLLIDALWLPRPKPKR